MTQRQYEQMDVAVAFDLHDFQLAKSLSLCSSEVPEPRIMLSDVLHEDAVIRLPTRSWRSISWHERRIQQDPVVPLHALL